MVEISKVIFACRGAFFYFTRGHGPDGEKYPYHGTLLVAVYLILPSYAASCVQARAVFQPR